EETFSSSLARSKIFMMKVPDDLVGVAFSKVVDSPLQTCAVSLAVASLGYLSAKKLFSKGRSTLSYPPGSQLITHFGSFLYYEYNLDIVCQLTIMMSSVVPTEADPPVEQSKQVGFLQLWPGID
ncbi:16092_t:CDS:2, partial [Acaulospora colombiana]